MIIEFSVGNYRSFRDTVTLSMVAVKQRSKNKSLDANNVVVLPEQPQLLTSAAVFGPNASGKSNLIEAMTFMRRFVLHSSEGTDATGGIDVDPFRLNSTTATLPSQFEIAFIIGNQRFRYGFEVTAQRVTREWLYTVPKQREALLFERNGDEIKVGDLFRQSRSSTKLTRPNALFLTVAAQFNGELAQQIVGWFRRMVTASGLDDFGLQMYTVRKMVDGDDAKEISAFVTKLDLGIMDLRVEKRDAEAPALPPKMPEEVRRAMQVLISHGNESGVTVAMKTIHQTFDASGQVAGMVEFDLSDDESAGTQKLFAMAGMLIKTLAEGRLLVVDELDSRLHTTLTREIVKLFSNVDTNPNHAQLIFTAQDTNLLDNDLLRRDQFWLVEKDSKGVSHLYSLSEFQGVRNDLLLDRSYLQGRFGAVPYVGDLISTLRETNNHYGK